MEIKLLQDLLIIAGLAIFVLIVCHRVRLPTVVGLLITGLLVGPHGMSVVGAVHEVEVMAEIGVILLLFSIGIEFSFKELRRIRKVVVLGGGLQVGSMVLVTYLIVRSLGRTPGEALFVGFLVSLSSTVIVLKLLNERNEIYSPQGQTSVGILIFQDLITVPMMLIVPFLAGHGGPGGSFQTPLVLLKSLGILGVILALGKWGVPWLFFAVARTRIRELFLLAVLAICFGVVWLSAAAGLSLALGAFLAGLIVSESEYSHRALGDVLPLRDAFSGFFFISIGMLLDFRFVVGNIPLVILCLGVVLILKILLTGVTTMILGYPLRVAVLTGLALAQLGEFSFILAASGMDYGLLNRDIFQLFLSVSVLTMVLTPLFFAIAPRFAEWGERLPLPERVHSGLDAAACPECERQAAARDHLVIIGFGLNGKNVARAARAADIPYVVVEMNPETVKRETGAGEVIFYGDATKEAVLGFANVEAARVAVVAINDPKASRRVIELIRRLSPSLYIVARTRYLHEVNTFYSAGADDVIPEEFETSVEIFTRVLARYLVPRDQIEAMVGEIRADGYGMLRSLSQESMWAAAGRPELLAMQVHALRVGERSMVAEQTLNEARLRPRFGVTVLAVRRGTDVETNPDGTTRIGTGDILIVMGTPEQVRTVTRELESRPLR